MRKVNDLSAVDKEGEKKEEIDRKSKKKKKRVAVLYILVSKENRATKCCQAPSILTLPAVAGIVGCFFFLNDFLCFK